jgi:hypothetical protein
MKNIDQLAKIAKNSLFDIHNVHLCYKNAEDNEEFTSIADVLEFGPPTDLDENGGEELELMNDHLYIFSEELSEFIVIQ